jgi:hypothetical protein
MFEMWYWRRMEKISWTDHVRKESVLKKDQEGEECPTNNREEGKLTELVRSSLTSKTRYGRTDRLNMRREDKEEDVSSYWMTLRKRKDPEN